MALPIWSISQISNNLSRSNLEWTTPAITFGFPTQAPSWSANAEGRGFSTFNANQREAARTAVDLFDDVIRPDFTETSGRAQVTFQNTNTSIGYAHAYFPGNFGAAGSAWFNSNYGPGSGTNNLLSPVTGQWGFMTFIHELGHAMGLDHPGDYEGNVSYETDAPYRQDSMMYTIMSYFGAEETGADHVASDGRQYYAQTPMMHDIKALQDMYGAETATRAGNTTYGFNSNSGSELFDFTQNRHPIVCIWDGGGNDTLDLSGFRTSSRVDLRPGTFSDADAMTKNISVAIGALIENAIGGAAADVLSGNTAANRLVGGGGNDRLIGGGGNDTLTGGVAADQFIFNAAAFGRDTISDFDDGLDKLVFKRSVADAFSDFSISGNGSTAVTLAVGGDSIVLRDDRPIAISQADFLFV
ncbi:MAG: M10 family metallopeptidase [Aestuariivirga sp.]